MLLKNQFGKVENIVLKRFLLCVNVFHMPLCEQFTRSLCMLMFSSKNVCKHFTDVNASFQ